MKILNKKVKNHKRMLTATTFVLMLSIAASFITALPVAFGQEKETTTAFLYERPSLVGIGQTIYILGWIWPEPAESWKNLTFTFTKPDGTTDTKFFAESAMVGRADFAYVVNQVGTWSVTLSFPGDEDFAGCVSTPTTFTVQQEPTAPLEKIVTYAYVDTVPKTIGVGQSIYVVGWVTPPSELRYVYHNYTFTITKPDGTTETRVHDSDAPATHSFLYTCNQQGTWSATLSWAGDYIHEDCISTPTTWTVQQGYSTPVYPSEPLPTGQWTYPISDEYYEWYQIAGSWPMPWHDAAGSQFNQYSKGPNTPHILWKIPRTAGGIIGENGYSGITGGVPNTVAALGRLFYTQSERYTLDGTNVGNHPVLYCINQYTGELIYRRDLPGKGSGSTLALEISARIKVDPTLTQSIPGAFSLWVMGGGIWEVDPWTGNTRYQWAGGPDSGFYDNGAIYFPDYPAIDNMTKFDCRTKEIVWTIGPIPKDAYIWQDLIITPLPADGGIPFAISFQSWNATSGDLLVTNPDLGMYSTEGPERNVVAYGKFFYHGIDMRVHAVSLYTGEEVWKSDPNLGPWGSFASYSEAAGYGNVYFKTWDGYVNCYDGETGKLNWKFFCGNTTETAMGNYVAWGQAIIADGKVFVATSEHTPPTPLPRGEKLYCLDAFTGDLIWSYPFMYSTTGGGISSGMLFAGNMYDGCLYSFGKGETATTVLALQNNAANGGIVLVQGTVTDQSPGAPDTPAIGDKYQSEWMQYLYNNKPAPTNAMGVPVQLLAVRSDGSTINIATVTSDAMGHYEYTWVPPANDTYKIIAKFEGSESYWASSEECGLSVGPTQSGASASNLIPAFSNTDMIIIAAVIVVAILVVFNILSVRKLRK